MKLLFPLLIYFTNPAYSSWTSRINKFLAAMNKTDECRRYKWSTLATNLLVSIWCHDMVQNHLKVSSRNQPIWDSIARYMTRKGFPVTGLQCRTRIKNMLCSYHEAVKKNDPSIIEPYFDIFKNVLSNRNLKKTDAKAGKVKQARLSEDSQVEKEFSSLSSDSVETKPCLSEIPADSEYQMEFLDVNNQEPAVPGLLISGSDIIKDLESVIIKAIDSQTKAITSAIKMQSHMIEKLLLAERERLETIMASERESRKQLETRLDKLLSKLEANPFPHVTYMGTLIEASRNQ